MEIESLFNLRLSEIVQKLPSAAGVFEKFDLDYCCHGKQTLEEACEGDLIKIGRVEKALKHIQEKEVMNKNFVHFENMEMDELISHIIEKHHRYIKESSQIIYAHLLKVSAKHGDRHPELKKIFELFKELKKEMEQHMFKEEQVLFPRMNFLHETFKSKNIKQTSANVNLSAPIEVMEMEHEKAGSILHLIREMTNNYNPPDEACTTYRLCFNELHDFECDLHQHVHLENNILFPNALKMQRHLHTILSN